MAYSASINLVAVEDDGLGGQRTISIAVANVIPTKPAFCGTGTATSTPAAVSLGSIGTPKAFILVNDGAVEITVDVGTDNLTVGASGSTSRPNAIFLASIPATPNVSTASGTAVYRTFILE